MPLLILKLGATGDVVRTTPLLRRFSGPVTWITASKNVPMLQGIRENLRCVSWEQRHAVADGNYDLVINLEDTLDVAQFAAGLKFTRLFGAHLDSQGGLTYTPD